MAAAAAAPRQLSLRNLDALRGSLGKSWRARCPKAARLASSHYSHLSSNRIPGSQSQNPCPFLAPESTTKQQTCSFLSLAPSLLGAKRMEYAEVRQLPYTAEQIYDIVADVGSYQQFVPWCNRSNIISHHNQFLRAELEVGFPPVVESYISEVSLEPYHQIRAVSKDGHLFQHLETLWQFEPGLPRRRDTCTVRFYVSFEFKSVLHSHLANLFSNEVVKQMVSAFEKRAEKLYVTRTVSRPHKAIRCS